MNDCAESKREQTGKIRPRRKNPNLTLGHDIGKVDLGRKSNRGEYSTTLPQGQKGNTKKSTSATQLHQHPLPTTFTSPTQTLRTDYPPPQQKTPAKHLHHAQGHPNNALPHTSQPQPPKLKTTAGNSHQPESDEGKERRRTA